ncbi:hypothetical protein OKW41_005477 [Paraburkholderia sp. UCT70]
MDEVKLYVGLDVHKDSMRVHAHTPAMIPNSSVLRATASFP